MDILQLRGAIESLNCQHLEIQKRELLTLVEAFAPQSSNGNGNGHASSNGNGNGHAAENGNGNGYASSNGNGTRQRLSPRENQVMTMILAGRRLKEIAANLDISVKTVTTHRSRLLRKLGIEDNLGLYRYGVRSGLISV